MHSVDDRTAGARIRDAAIQVFARDGFSKATIRAIAEAAGVSPALVMHHYGSKAALRDACDRHVLDTARAEKLALMADGSRAGAGPVAERPDIRAQLDYLTRALQEGEAVADRWFDALVRHTEDMFDSLPPDLLVSTSDPTARAVVVVAQSLATLTFAAQISRHLEQGDPRDPTAADRLARAVTELQTRGLFTRDPAGATHG